MVGIEAFITPNLSLSANRYLGVWVSKTSDEHTILSRDYNLFTFGHTSNSANWDLSLSYYV